VTRSPAGKGRVVIEAVMLSWAATAGTVLEYVFKTHAYNEFWRSRNKI